MSEPMTADHDAPAAGERDRDRIREQLVMTLPSDALILCSDDDLYNVADAIAALRANPTGESAGWSTDMAAAPKDGTLLLLEVDYSAEDADHALEDATLARTVGFNNHDNDGVDEWMFAGWCWSHDHFVEGRGTPVRWRPFPARGDGLDAGGVLAFAQAVLHGDDEHRAWLMEAAHAFVAGTELPPPRGKGLAAAPSPRPGDVRTAFSHLHGAFDPGSDAVEIARLRERIDYLEQALAHADETSEKFEAMLWELRAPRPGEDAGERVREPADSLIPGGPTHAALNPPTAPLPEADGETTP